LNDWGCGTKGGTETSFSGCIQLAPQSVLQQMMEDQSLHISYVPRPEHDLEMVVKVLYQRLNPFYSSIWDGRDPEKLHTFWEQELAPKMWCDLLLDARNCKYPQLKKKIRRILA